ncbi:MAG TPA: F0F1 ATP synthase subunit delta [Gemmatimonadaceae bacterium]|nr:F0F1 ATP synthase subunit delta [Gemmatimonadaceae bacterium]
MRDTTISRNYAEALFTLAQKANDLRGWGAMITEVAEAVDRDRTLRLFLESPRIDAAKKSAVLGRAFQDRMPRVFVRFLQTLVRNRRQMLIPSVAREYLDLVDASEGRMHATVTMAKAPGEEELAIVSRELSRAFGKTVVPHVTVNPAILGGVVVRVGDTVLDGSVRRRLARLRTSMVEGR